MKKILIITGIILSLSSCKKEKDNPSFVITDVNGVNHTYMVYPSEPYGHYAISSVSYAPVAPGNPYSDTYTIVVALGSGVNSNIHLLVPNLEINNETFDSTTIFTKSFIIEMEGVIYFANSMTIKNLSIQTSPHSWVGEPNNSIASGSMELSVSAIKTMNTNGNITGSQALNKEIHIKGNFKNIFANK